MTVKDRRPEKVEHTSKTIILFKKMIKYHFLNNSEQKKSKHTSLRRKYLY
jgi:hypothetical protein